MLKGNGLWTALALIVAFLVVGTMDYLDARTADCDKHGMDYDWDFDVCVERAAE